MIVVKICVLIPVFNESKTIGSIVHALKEEGLSIVIIDDGSTDQSGKIAKEQGAFVIRHAQKHGKGHSLRKGFKYALDKHFDGVITMDGDAQHDVSDIDQLLGFTKTHSDCVVVGNRMSEPKNMPFIRYWTNRLMSALISISCRQRILDTQCGFRFISASVLKELELTSNGYEIESEMLMKAAKQGFVIHSVPVKTIYRGEESHINPIGDTFRFITFFIKEICS